VYTLQAQIDDLVDKKRAAAPPPAEEEVSVFDTVIGALEAGNPDIGSVIEAIPQLEDQYTVLLAAHRYGLIDLPQYASFIADALERNDANLPQIQRLMGVMSEDVIEKVRQYMEDAQ
jgi:hypothetical protein